MKFTCQDRFPVLEVEGDDTSTRIDQATELLGDFLRTGNLIEGATVHPDRGIVALPRKGLEGFVRLDEGTRAIGKNEPLGLDNQGVVNLLVVVADQDEKILRNGQAEPGSWLNEEVVAVPFLGFRDFLPTEQCEKTLELA